MVKELIDRTWACLPREFKEEVKETYREYTEKIAATSEPEYRIVGYIAAQTELELLFGKHNLTSDAVEEEMLTVPRKKVQEKWQRAYEQEAKYSRAQDSPVAREELYYNRGILSILDTLFGSKCLLDAHEDNFTSIEPKPAEQREDLIPPNSGELESQEADRQCNTIIKDSFAKERRLNIAAQIVTSMVGSDDWTTWRGGTNKEIWHNMAKSSLEIADALIDECKKGGIK